MLLFTTVLRSLLPLHKATSTSCLWNRKPSTCDADLFVSSRGDQQHNLRHIHVQLCSSVTFKETAGQLLVSKPHRLANHDHTAQCDRLLLTYPLAQAQAHTAKHTERTRS